MEKFCAADGRATWPYGRYRDAGNGQWRWLGREAQRMMERRYGMHGLGFGNFEKLQNIDHGSHWETLQSLGSDLLYR